jgi:hypothetical protein
MTMLLFVIIQVSFVFIEEFYEYKTDLLSFSLMRCTDHVTPLYPQKLALTSPTSGGRSVGIVRSWTKSMELVS